MNGVLIAAAGAAWESAALGFLEASPEFRLERRCVDVADLVSSAQTGEATAALLSLDLPGLDADTLYRLVRAEVHPVAVEASAERCAALGITTRLAVAELDGLAANLPRAGEVSVEPPIPAGEGSVVAVWGPAGAPGRSTVALGLADAWSRRGLQTILVDADPYGGAIAQMLGILDEVSGLLAASRAANDGRASELADHLYGLGENLAVLTGLPRPDLWPQVRAGAAERVFDRLRSQAQVSVLDVGFSLEDSGSFDSSAPRRNQLTLQALEAADHVFVVGRADPVGLTRLVRGMHELETAIPAVKISVVINMMRPSIGWSDTQIAATVARLAAHEPEAFLPFDQGAVDSALIGGRLLGERQSDSRLAKAIDRLAAQWSSQHLRTESAPAIGG